MHQSVLIVGLEDFDLSDLQKKCPHHGYRLFLNDFFGINDICPLLSNGKVETTSCEHIYQINNTNKCHKVNIDVQFWLPDDDSDSMRYSSLSDVQDYITTSMSGIAVPIWSQDDVIYIVKDGYAEFIASGSFAEVYLGKMIFNNKMVIIKDFQNSPFCDIMEEARTLVYLEQTGYEYLPKFYGLVLTGATIRNLSIVQEYYGNGVTLRKFLRFNRISDYEYLVLALQIAEGLEGLHKRDILMNDLHSKNILISGKRPNIKIAYIDMGYTTYREGFIYKRSFDYLHDFKHLAPEVQWGNKTNVTADIYSYGHILIKITDRANISVINNISCQCQSMTSAFRPSLNSIIFTLRDHINELIYTRSLPNAMLRESRPHLWNIVNMTTHRANAIDNGHLFWDAISVPMLDSSSVGILTNSMDGYINISSASSTVYKGKLIQLDCAIVIRIFKSRSFENILSECKILTLLNDTGFIPRFYGLLPKSYSLEFIGIVQEYVGGGNTLHDYLIISRYCFTRARLLHISILFIRSLEQIHKMNILVNNIKLNNIILQCDEIKCAIKWIDLKRTTYRRSYFYAPSYDPDVFRYLSPDVRAGGPTSFASDIYSLCFALRQVLKPILIVNIHDLLNECIVSGGQIHISILQNLIYNAYLSDLK